MPSPARLVINTSPLLCGLQVTGSIGLLLRAKRAGRIDSLRQTLERMRAHGIWLSDAVVAFALRESGEF